MLNLCNDCLVCLNLIHINFTNKIETLLLLARRLAAEGKASLRDLVRDPVRPPRYLCPHLTRGPLMNNDTGPDASPGCTRGHTNRLKLLTWGWRITLSSGLSPHYWLGEHTTWKLEFPTCGSLHLLCNPQSSQPDRTQITQDLWETICEWKIVFSMLSYFL